MVSEKRNHFYPRRGCDLCQIVFWPRLAPPKKRYKLLILLPLSTHTLDCLPGYLFGRSLPLFGIGTVHRTLNPSKISQTNLIWCCYCCTVVGYSLLLFAGSSVVASKLSLVVESQFRLSSNSLMWLCRTYFCYAETVRRRGGSVRVLSIVSGDDVQLQGSPIVHVSAWDLR